MILPKVEEHAASPKMQMHLATPQAQMLFSSIDGVSDSVAPDPSRCLVAEFEVAAEEHADGQEAAAQDFPVFPCREGMAAGSFSSPGVWGAESSDPNSYLAGVVENPVQTEDTVLQMHSGDDITPTSGAGRDEDVACDSQLDQFSPVSQRSPLKEHWKVTLERRRQEAGLEGGAVEKTEQQGPSPSASEA